MMPPVVYPLMTQRLFYDDPYLKDFDARVVRHLEVDGLPAVLLDRTAFYPTGGGQPHDRGWLSGAEVVDVRLVEEDVVHVLAQGLPSELVHGRLDWERRFEHMQQHTGQHILSQACMLTMHAETVAFHLGELSSTIDLARPDLAAGELAEAERLANEVVCENREVSTRWVDAEQIAALPLRRPPQVEGPVRVVQVAGFDWSACGGTHVRASAEVGVIKVVSADRHRGGTTRVTFLCGRRAFADYRRKQELVRAMGAFLTTGEEELLGAVQRLSDELKEARRSAVTAREALIAAEAERLYRNGTELKEAVLVQSVYGEGNWTAADVAALATRLARYPMCIALLAWSGDKSQLTFTRGAGVAADMGGLMRAACGAIGGRGGGRPDWAQGGVASGASLAQALSAAVEAFIGSVPTTGSAGS
jgi:alanyl-tRNA synthetase